CRFVITNMDTRRAEYRFLTLAYPRLRSPPRVRPLLVCRVEPQECVLPSQTIHRASIRPICSQTVDRTCLTIHRMIPVQVVPSPPSRSLDKVYPSGSDRLPPV
ncbi:hypothetical protein PENTCL1PPCAC_19485, partial [Pristionchus entomophagus]